ncbi:oligosaccharide flippase family protein [Belliella marina]|uniref:Oligosaccharide flippase family protein n=1 Tax=Belliella marina TaxID=1644146 RepID=A0ABW4VPJ7_9BACT
MSKQGKHSLIYLVGRGIPGIINFAALSVYTRLLSPEDYGQYAIVISTVALCNTLLFQWIRMGLLRYLPKFDTELKRAPLYANIAVGYATAIFVSLLMTGLLYIINPGEMVVKLAVFGMVLLWTEAFFEIALELLRSNLQVIRYSLSFTLKSSFALGMGILMVYNGFGVRGLLISLAASTILTTILSMKSILLAISISFRHFKLSFFREFLIYGIPFTVTFGMTFIFNSSDRYFINYFLGDRETGLYAVAYDLARQSLWVVMSAINLGSFPLAIRALESSGVVAANIQLIKNLQLLLKISLPISLGFIALSSEVVDLFIGEKFVAEAKQIVPYIIGGTVMVGAKNFYFDQSFQLGKRTYLQIYPVIAAAVVNVGLNMFIISWLGVIGAVISTLISFSIALTMSIVISRRVYPLPFPFIYFLKVLLASSIMGLGLFYGKEIMEGYVLRLVVLVPLGALVYLLLLRVFKIDFFK